MEDLPDKQGVLKVKNSFFCATFVALFCVVPFAASSSSAQQQQYPSTAATPAQHAAAPGVELIDLIYIFDNYKNFTEMKAGMKRQVDAAEARLKIEGDELKRTGQQISNLPLGSPERNRLEEAATQQGANLQVKVAKEKKDFLRQESHIYYSVYQEILGEIRVFSERNNISLVLRFSGDQIDPNNPQAVLQDINKSVIYYNKHIDLTKIILSQLNNRWQGNAGTSSRPTRNQSPIPNRR
jgi:Skp family chaperone for outer membrane proteins